MHVSQVPAQLLFFFLVNFVPAVFVAHTVVGSLKKLLHLCVVWILLFILGLLLLTEIVPHLGSVI